MFKPEVKLFDHQKAGVEFILNRQGLGALAWEVGCGKTIGGLKAYEELRKLNPGLKLLVVCPLSLIESAWGEDIKKFTTYTYTSLRNKNWRAGSDIYIINYESLISKKNKGLIRSITAPHDFIVILDESSKIKNHSSQTTKELLRLRDLFRYRLVMSGTMAPNNELEYWAQVIFIGDGILHHKFHAFKNHYFHLERNGAVMASGGFIDRESARKIYSQGWKHEITVAKRLDLMERIGKCCHFAKKKDCLDLPDQVHEIRSIEMGKDQRRIYKKMKNDLIVEIQNSDVVAQVALAKILKLREICSGFAIDDKDKIVSIGQNPKLRELNCLLEEIGDEQAIIWCEFIKEVVDVKGELQEKAVCLCGSTNDKDGSIEAFRSGKAQYLIAHPKSAAHGLTFVNCSVQIFYALSYSYENYIQCKGRTHRYGQVNKCVYVHLLMKDSIEEVMLGVLRRKGKAQEIVEEVLRGR